MTVVLTGITLIAGPPHALIPHWSDMDGREPRQNARRVDASPQNDVSAGALLFQWMTTPCPVVSIGGSHSSGLVGSPSWRTSK